MTFVVLVFLLFICILRGQISAEESGPVISIKSGKIKGLILKSASGNDYFAYRAIPYGKSTAGQMRFKPPQPVEPWDEVFDATQFGPECPQFNMVTRGVEGSEDCLVLNVYTPKLPSAEQKEPLPVLVFIHGGGFLVGTGSYLMYGPRRFMDHNVVLVTLNYRLGVLGFLSTEDEASPGNYGMLDQVLALRWVKENIANFGGNSEKITIFGESAGSASVIYHLLSPLSKGLFHGAIAQSGTVLDHWAHQKHPLQIAKAVAELVDCPTNVTKALVDCFTEKPFYDLIRKQFDLQVSSFFPILNSPVTERSGGHGFLPDDPMVLLREGRIANKVPLILGLTELEFFSFYHDLMKHFKYEGQEHLDKEFPKVMSSIFDMEPYEVPYKNSEIFKAIYKEYFQDSDVNKRENFQDVLFKLMSDVAFGIGIAQTADLMASANIQTWAYIYKHVGEHGFCELFGVAPGKYASHADELFIQFPFFFAQLVELNDKDKKMAQIMNSLWANFANGDNLSIARDGNSVQWESYSPQNPSYLQLNLQPQMKTGKLSDKLEFWSETLFKYAENIRVKSEL